MRCFLLIIVFIIQKLIRYINFFENYLKLKILFKIIIKKIFAQFFAKFYNLKIVFDQSKVNKLSFYCFYNYKKKFEDKNNQLSKNRIY